MEGAREREPMHVIIFQTGYLEIEPKTEERGAMSKSAVEPPPKPEGSRILKVHRALGCICHPYSISDHKGLC